MASREIKNSLIDPDQDHREKSSEHNDEVVRLRQQLIDLHQAWASGMPPTSLLEGLGNISNCPPLSQAPFFAPTSHLSTRQDSLRDIIILAVLMCPWQLPNQDQLLSQRHRSYRYSWLCHHMKLPYMLYVPQRGFLGLPVSQY